MIFSFLCVWLGSSSKNENFDKSHETIFSENILY